MLLLVHIVGFKQVFLCEQCMMEESFFLQCMMEDLFQHYNFWTFLMMPRTPGHSEYKIQNSTSPTGCTPTRVKRFRVHLQITLKIIQYTVQYVIVQCTGIHISRELKNKCFFYQNGDYFYKIYNTKIFRNWY